MSGTVRPVGPIGSPRLDALGPRSRPAGSGGNGSNFETLLAQAADRQVIDRPAPDPSMTAKPWRRPVGALGVSLAPPVPASVSAVPASTVPTGSTGGGTAGQAVISAAAEHLGVPYLWGGTDPVNGFDCSGLVQDAYRAIGVEMPKWSRHQATMGAEIGSVDNALPGDVLAFGDPVNHVALYVGDGQMLHAPKTGDVVRIGPIDRPIATIRRIVSPGPVQTGADRPSAVVAPGPGQAERLYRPLFEAAGQRWNVDPSLLAAVAETESGFDPAAVSPVGARGLMQFMPATAAEMGVDPLDPASAIDGAARYLRLSLDRFESPEMAIASYNAGRGAVARHGGVPPFTETQNYVRKVLDAWRSRT